MTDHEDASPAPWYLRVLPVTGLLVLLVALAAIAVPPFRDQLELSLNRQPDPYVELYFPRSVPAGGQAVCSRHGSKVRVSFVVASHLEGPEAVAWQAVVQPTSRPTTPLRHQGALHTVPGRASGLTTTYSVPARGGYTVSVSLPDQHQQLRAHCPGRTS